MNSNRKHTYVLGTGLSHDGSACLLKDGIIRVAIEKERITRLKHDGGNDSAAVAYCLEAEGIALEDLSLIVQNANFGNFERGNAFFGGARLFADCPVPIVTISHHLAHAYSALGSCPFDKGSILVVDGCGNGWDECADLPCPSLPAAIEADVKHLYFEKDSYYLFEKGTVQAVFKDFSPWGMSIKGYPMLPNTTKHSIGGVYAGVSSYCFRENSDLGKLMGLAPYGRRGVFDAEIFELSEGRVFVNYDWMKGFNRPARSHEEFRANFQYYADIAYWVQREVERALLYLVDSRCDMAPGENLAYAGGVALNAVANALLLRNSKFKKMYIVPAAGDNGVAMGCAFYGWLEVLKRERIKHSGSIFLGRRYSSKAIRRAIEEVRDLSVSAAQGVREDILTTALHLLHDSISSSKACGWSTILAWRVKEGVSFTTVFDGVACRLVQGELAAASAVTLAERGVLLKLFQGGLHPARASERGLIQCTNLDALLRFHSLVDWRTRRRVLLSGLTALGLHGAREIQVTEVPDIVERTADLLAVGKIVAWFQGGSEFGPRALGHRSLLADPRKIGVRDIINKWIKRREEFRPFAPSVLQADAPTYFNCDYESPYMILVAQVRAEWRESLQSVVHVDGSARIQTVTSDWNELYCRLLEAFKKRTGLSVILNTSLNRRGMPIVETPRDALNFFLESPQLDVLVLDRFIVEHG